MGFSGQMHGVVLLDKSLAVLRPSLIWCDQRSQAQCDWITQKVGAEQLIQYVSNPALTGFSAPKILWVRDNEPKVYERAAHFLLPKDFVRFRLTGEFATDVSDASGTLLFDVTHRRWSPEMLSALEIDAQILPKAFESPEITGEITREVAVLTGLSAGTPVVAGARRPGGQRRRQRHRSPGTYLRHAGHFGRYLHLHRRAQTRPARAHPHVLPCGSRKMARHGRHAGRGTFLALVSR